MTRWRIGRLRILALPALVVFLLHTMPLDAQIRKQAVMSMSERVFNTIEAAQVEIDQGKLSAARGLIEEMLSGRLSDYEQAHGLTLLGYAWYQEDNLGNARASYEQAVKLEKIPSSMRANLLITLGQICLFTDSHADAETYLRRLLALPEHDSAANQVLLAAAVLGQARYSEAKVLLEDALARERASGNRPKEDWLIMLSSVYYELRDYSAMRDTLAELTIHYPREQYVMNLAALTGELGQRDRQLALVESLSDDARLQNPGHVKLLANLFLEQALPYKAAVLLETALEDGRLEPNGRMLELLSQAWFLAADTQRAIEPLRRAAELSDDGKLYLRVAHLHMDTRDWRSADRAAELALKTGSLRQEGEALLIRGMALANLEQFEDASALITRATKFPDSREQASQWLSFVESELQRLKTLKSETPRIDE